MNDPRALRRSFVVPKSGTPQGDIGGLWGVGGQYVRNSNFQVLLESAATSRYNETGYLAH